MSMDFEAGGEMVRAQPHSERLWVRLHLPPPILLSPAPVILINSLKALRRISLSRVAFGNTRIRSIGGITHHPRIMAD